MKIRNVFIVVLVVILSVVAFCSCSKKDETEKNNSYQNTIVKQEDSGARVLFLNEVTDVNTAISSTTLTSYSFTHDEIQNLEEGLLSLIELRETDDFKYNMVRVGLYNQIGTVIVSNDELNDGIKIMVFTSVTQDQSTQDNAKRVNIDDYSLVQTNKAVDELTISDGAVIFVTKVNV